MDIGGYRQQLDTEDADDYDDDVHTIDCVLERILTGWNCQYNRREIQESIGTPPPPPPGGGTSTPTKDTGIVFGRRLRRLIMAFNGLKYMRVLQ